MTSDLGLVGDRSLRVEQGCQEEFSPKYGMESTVYICLVLLQLYRNCPPRPIGADNLFRPYHDYIDRTQYSPVNVASATRPPSIQVRGGREEFLFLQVISH